MFRRKKVESNLEEKRIKLLHSLECVVWDWRATHPEVDLEVSKWENPYDYIDSLTLHCPKPDTADVVLAIDGTGLSVFVDDGWVVGDTDPVPPYDETLIVRVLDSISAGDAQVHYYPFSHTVEIGHGESLISATKLDSTLSLAAWRAYFRGRFRRKLLRTKKYAPWS